MDKPNIPESLREMVETAMRSTLDRALQEAFNAGYLKGADDVTQRVVAAAKGAASAPATQEREVAPLKPMSASEITKGLRELHPNSADARRFPYGAVSNAFREVLRGATVFGLTKMDLIASVCEVLGADVSGMDHRDTLKRLKKAQELRIHEGRFFAGPALVRRKENGAQATMPLGAPEAGEVAASPIESPSLAKVMS